MLRITQVEFFIIIINPGHFSSRFEAIQFAQRCRIFKDAIIKILSPRQYHLTEEKFLFKIWGLGKAIRPVIEAKLHLLLK